MDIVYENKQETMNGTQTNVMNRVFHSEIIQPILANAMYNFE